jgi:hypothetical protein
MTGGIFPKHGADWVEVMLATQAYKQADAMMEALGEKE